MSEFVERLAKRAMRDGYLDENDPPEEVERVWQTPGMEGIRETCLVIARAALQELRDNPTEAMLRAGLLKAHLSLQYDGDSDDLRDELSDAFTAMIDKALEE